MFWKMELKVQDRIGGFTLAPSQSARVTFNEKTHPLDPVLYHSVEQHCYWDPLKHTRTVYEEVLTRQSTIDNPQTTLVKSSRSHSKVTFIHFWGPLCHIYLIFWGGGIFWRWANMLKGGFRTTMFNSPNIWRTSIHFLSYLPGTLTRIHFRAFWLF